MLKKLISVLLAVSMLSALSACSLEKISEIRLPPRPGTAAAKEAKAAALEEAEQAEEPEQATKAEMIGVAEPETEESAPAHLPAAEETTTSESAPEPSEEPAPVEEPMPEQKGFVPEPTPDETEPSPEPVVEETPQTMPEPEPAPQAQTPSATPVLSISQETKPSDMARYKSMNLYGIIETDYGVITQVYAVIIDERGEPVQDCAYYPGTKSFDLADTVNYCLHFGRLDVGNYIYQLNAAAQNGEITVSATLTEVAFRVNGPAQTKTEAPAEAGSEEEIPPDPSQYSARQTEDGSNEGQIWNCLIAQLNNPFAVAGILGNIRAESSCLPYAVENDTSKGLEFSLKYTEEADNGTISRDIFAYSPPGDSLGYGFGLCQWSMDRKGSLYDYAKDNDVSLNSINTQCGFLMMELTTYFPSLLEYLKTCTDAREASRRFCTDYEKAAVWGGRIDYTVDYLEKYAKN